MYADSMTEVCDSMQAWLVRVAETFDLHLRKTEQWHSALGPASLGRPTLHIHRPNAHPHIRRKVPYFNSFGSSELHTQTSQRIGFIASSSGSVLR